MSQPLWRLPSVRQLVAVTLLGFSSYCLTLGSVPSWAVSGGVPEGAAGLATSVMLGATVLTQAAVPALAGRLGTGRTLAYGLLALGVPAPLYMLSANLTPLLAISAVRGTGFAVLTVLGAKLAADLVTPERHGEAIGLYGLAIAMPNLAAVPAGVALTQAGAFAWVAALAALPLLAVPFALSLGHAAPDQPAAAMPAGTSGAAVRAVLAPSAVLLVVTLAGGGLVTFLPIQRPAGPLATVALVCFGATAAVTRWRAGLLADRHGHRVLLPASVATAVAGMAVVAAGLQGPLAADLTVLLGATLFGAGYGSVQNLTLMVAFSRSGPGHTTTASAVWNAAFDAGTAVGAVAVGAVAATGLGLPWSFGVTAALIALSLPLATRMRRLVPG